MANVSETPATPRVMAPAELLTPAMVFNAEADATAPCGTPRRVMVPPSTWLAELRVMVATVAPAMEAVVAAWVVAAAVMVVEAVEASVTLAPTTEAAELAEVKFSTVPIAFPFWTAVFTVAVTP